ncbi:MAG: hypothetical protein KBH12_01965 [Synergistaceae bacterium]|nr:hypothetical protein [Synergistaceae bacterium]MBP9957332.1 hypothetical protein [Synergistaceae bacterium]
MKKTEGTSDNSDKNIKPATRAGMEKEINVMIVSGMVNDNAQEPKTQPSCINSEALRKYHAHLSRRGLVSYNAPNGTSYQFSEDDIARKLDINTGAFHEGQSPALGDFNERELSATEIAELNQHYNDFVRAKAIDFHKKRLNGTLEAVHRSAQRGSRFLRDNNALHEANRILLRALVNDNDSIRFVLDLRDMIAEINKIISSLNQKRESLSRGKATQRPVTFVRSTSLPRTRQRSRHTAAKRSCLATTGQDTGDPDQPDPPGHNYRTTLTVLSLTNVNFSELSQARINPGHCCSIPLGGEAA